MSFGWSAGDILATVNTLAKVGKSLKESGGAATEYQEAVAFLSSVSRTLSGVQSLLRDNPNLRWGADLVEQGNILKSAIENLEQKIKKYDKSLGIKTQRQKARRIPRQVQFALFLSDQVKELRTAITQPQLILDGFINLQALTSILDASRTTSLSDQKLESLTQNVSQLMPAITTIVNTINHVIGSEIREVKTLQETSEMQIRDDLMDFKTHMREVETLQRSIADRNQADSQAQLQRQAELQHSVGALHDYLETRLDLLLQEKIEEPISRGPNSMINYSQMLLGVVQVIGSGIASGIGAMAALSSHMSTTRSDQGRSSMAPYQIASPAIHPPYEDAWENAYKAAENEFAKHSSSHSVGARCTRTAGTSSSDSVTYRLPILMGWRKCHVCAREIDRALHGDKCPDCEHEMCDECTDVQLTDTSDTWGSDRTISFPAKKPNEERINVKDSSLQ